MTDSPSLTAARRRRELAELADGPPVDVLVVGGGITGAGVALDAVSRGLSVALLERADLAHGTSRWSSKLAHGGLRYLAKGDFGVAWESAVERAVLIDRTAPHLARALPQLVPLGDTLTPALGALTEAGLRLGDVLRRASGTKGRRLPRARRVEAAEALRWVPALKTEGLRGGLLHWDAQLEDDARLVVAIARTAAARGAKVLTRVGVTKVTGLGVQARDELTGDRLEVRAHHVVNATGVWAGTLADDVRLRPSSGGHLLLPATRLGDPPAAVSVPVEGKYGRWVFALPRPDGLVLVGLTDEPYEGASIPDLPEVGADAERWMLDALSRALERPLGPEDVVGRFAGLRPLLDDGHGQTADVSRRHAILEDPSSGAITVVGGKLTTYRRMAEDAVDLVAARPGVAAGPCRTRDLPVVGAQPPGRTLPGVPARLARRYGSEAARLDPAGFEPLAPGVPLCAAEVRWAVEHEGALTVEDVLDRRSRVGLVPAWREAVRPAVEGLLGDRAEVVR